MKRAVVIALERGCALFDRLLAMTGLEFLACGHAMAIWSDRLDQRWHAGVWTKIGDSE